MLNCGNRVSWGCDPSLPFDLVAGKSDYRNPVDWGAEGYGLDLSLISDRENAAVNVSNREFLIMGVAMVRKHWRPESTTSVFSRDSIQVRRKGQARKLGFAVVIAFLVGCYFLFLIAAATGSRKPFDLGQFIGLFQTVIALCAMCFALWASLSQPQVQAQIAYDAADERFHRTIGSMVVIGRHFAQIVEEAPHHFLCGWQARTSADLLGQMRSGTLFSFPDSMSLEATLSTIFIGEQLLCNCTEASPEAIDELGGETFRRRVQQLNKLRTALDELALLAAAWDIKAPPKVSSRADYGAP
ncbi:hypothetical protein D3C86_1209680 [compost metagenome]